jgi:hypothetical protein
VTHEYSHCAPTLMLKLNPKVPAVSSRLHQKFHTTDPLIRPYADLLLIMRVTSTSARLAASAAYCLCCSSSESLQHNHNMNGASRHSSKDKSASGGCARGIMHAPKQAPTSLVVLLP